MDEHTLLTLLLTNHDDLIESYIHKYLGDYGIELYRENKNAGLIRTADIIFHHATTTHLDHG